MSNPLFYGSVVALDRNTHRNLRLDTGHQRFGFAREAHLVPALVEEFGAASVDLPVAFLPGPKRSSPVFMTGLIPGQSLMIDEAGAWLGRYIPAYLRRYPFIIGETADGDEDAQALLCFDEDFAGVHADDGVTLFSEDGTPSETAQAALALSEGYRRGAAQTDAFCDRLQELELLRPVTIDVKQGEGQGTTVHGLLTIDEAAFGKLSDETFIELRHSGMLEPIYAHFHSLRMLDAMSARLATGEDAVAA